MGVVLLSAVPLSLATLGDEAVPPRSPPIWTLALRSVVRLAMSVSARVTAPVLPATLVTGELAGVVHLTPVVCVLSAVRT